MRTGRLGILLATLLSVVATTVSSPSAVLARDPIPAGSVVLPNGRVLLPPPANVDARSIHEEMLETLGGGHFDFVPGTRPTVSLTSHRPASALGPMAEPTPNAMLASYVAPAAAAAPVSAAAALPNGLRKEILGFLPYWMLSDTALASMNYHLLSTIAYFSVGATKDGTLSKGTTTSPSSGWAGWTSSRMTDVINQAHGAGVRVVLTVTMMAGDSTGAANQAALLGSSTARANLIGQIVSAVDSRNADGVNLDFEPVSSSLRASYTSFARDLKAGLVAAGVGSYLTVCTTGGAATWSTGYDVAGLTAAGAADQLFVMGYDYSWSGSARAGGVAPIDSPYTVDLDGTMADYLSQTSGSKLIWGVPYYGRTWPTSSDQLNATTVAGTSHAYYYTSSLSRATQYGRRWDDVGKVPWFRYIDPATAGWVQGYYDDVASLGAKYDLVNGRGFTGTGMWTLLMDQGHDELWKLLAAKFVTDTEPPVGGIKLLPASTDASAVLVNWRAIDYASGVDHYDLQAREVGSDTWQPWLTGTAAVSGWFVGHSGAAYEFRVSAVDLKGNAQPWASVAPQPAEIGAGTFARVTTSSLNVRNGPGTGYAIVGSATSGATVQVIDGPTAASGYNWWRVQYGFNEWPSADLPHIGFVAAGTSSSAYIQPAAPPTIIALDPFIRGLTDTGPFSPNRDGVRDTAGITYDLAAAASAARLEVVDAGGSIARTMDLGPQAAGANAASWDGTLGDGSVAPEGRYLLRVVATEAGGASHAAPANSSDPTLVAVAGLDLDLTAPELNAATPSAGTGMVNATRRIMVTFSEPVVGVDATTLQFSVAGTPLPAALAWDAAGRVATVTPAAPLPVNALITVQLPAGVVDPAGNTLPASSWTFSTAPGSVYAPARKITFKAGTYVGYVIGGTGQLTSGKRATLSVAGNATVSQRSTIPNLPGRWLFVETGTWAGRWIRESGSAHLWGSTERRSYTTSTRIVILSGTRTGYRFDSAGAVTAHRTVTITSAVGAYVTARAVINGSPYFAVSSGTWSGYWMPESSAIYRRGAIEQLNFAVRAPMNLGAGTYTGYRYDTSGTITATRRVTLSATTGMTASAWAVINGRGQYLMATGTWAGYWIREGAGVWLASLP